MIVAQDAVKEKRKTTTTTLGYIVYCKHQENTRMVEQCLRGTEEETAKGERERESAKERER